jgi:hypothetical protein
VLKICFHADFSHGVFARQKLQLYILAPPSLAAKARGINENGKE